jgi:hypothetical protein
LQADQSLGASLELLLGSSYDGAHAPGAAAVQPSGSTAPANPIGGTTAAEVKCTA